MKRCPDCRRDYYDDTLLYCLDDGNALLEGPAAADEPATADCNSRVDPIPRATIPEAETAIFTALELNPTLNYGDPRFRIAVIPFEFRGPDIELTNLAEGLSEDIVTGLSRFTYIRVIGDSHALKTSNPEQGLHSRAGETEPHYVVQGKVRQTGNVIRVGVRLYEAATSTNIWAENFDHERSDDDLLSMQEHIVSCIVSTIADPYGILPRNMRLTVKDMRPDQMSAYDALLRSFVYADRVTAEEHGEAKAGLERAVSREPQNSDCWAMLSIMLADEYGHGLGADHSVLGMALKAAQRAVDSNPSNHRAQQALSWVLFLRKEFAAARIAAEKAVSLNPMDGCTAAYAGQVLAYSGDWQKGCSMIERAIPWNPGHPGWYWYALFLDAYRRADFERAVQFAVKMNLPGVPLGYVALAAAFAQFGDSASAANAVQDLLELRPDYARLAATELGKWWDTATVGFLIEGLRKAGLEIPSS